MFNFDIPIPFQEIIFEIRLKLVNICNNIYANGCYISFQYTLIHYRYGLLL